MMILANDFGEFFKDFWDSTSIAGIFQDGGWKDLIMILIAFLLLYLAIAKKAEPYLLIPMAIGCLLSNIADLGFRGANAPNNPIFYEFVNTDPDGNILSTTYSGLIGYLYKAGITTEIFPCLIFLGIGATTDFGPLIAQPSMMILGAAAQLGIFITFLLAIPMGFTAQEAASIGIIGGADGPTAILTASTLSPKLLASIAIAAYSYMALIPFIQPPIIRLLTTKKERRIHMDEVKPVSKKKRILFPIVVTAITALIVPSCAPLIGSLMLGNLIKESGVVPKLVETSSNAILYTSTIMIGICVGATATGETFLNLQTLEIFALGIFAFVTATAGGVLIGKLMEVCTHGKVNPMIGAAGVSAVPMAARVVQKEAQREDSSNFLLMQAMGPNVAGVIGSAVAAGLFIMAFGA